MNITKIKVREYFYNTELVEKYCALFIEFNLKKWIKFIIDDGVIQMNTIKDIDKEGTFRDTEYYYPLVDYPIPDNWGNIISLNEYRYKDINGESAGFIFILENKIMSYIQVKDKLEFIEGIKNEIMNNYIIIPIEKWKEKLA